LIEAQYIPCKITPIYDEMRLKPPENIHSITPYPPGKPMDELEREYGVKNSIKLASNENPWGPSPKAIQAVQEAALNLHRYPDGSSYYLLQAIAQKEGVDPSQIVLGNGSNEVIEFLVKAYVETGDEVITSHPSFLMYQKFVQVRGGKNVIIPLKEMKHDLDAILKNINERTKLVFLDNPNNPTGTAINRAEFNDFLGNVPDTVLVALDEAYVDFMEDDEKIDLHPLLSAVNDQCGVVALRTFSKAYGLAGLRVGYGLMAQNVAESLHKVRQPFNINSPAQAGAQAAIEDVDYFNKIVIDTCKGREFLRGEVEKLGCISYPSHTNFFLIDVCGDATRLYEAMLYKGVIIRSMKAYGYANFIRLTVGTEAENSRFISSLKVCLKDLGYV